MRRLPPAVSWLLGVVALIVITPVLAQIFLMGFMATQRPKLEQKFEDVRRELDNPSGPDVKRVRHALGEPAPTPPPPPPVDAEPKPIPVIVLNGEPEVPSVLASPLVPLAAAGGGAVMVVGLVGLGALLLFRSGPEKAPGPTDGDGPAEPLAQDP